MQYELWIDEHERGTICPVGPRGDLTRLTLQQGAVHEWTFEAASHFDAMTKYFEYRGWGVYAASDPAHDQRTFIELGWE